MSPHEHDIYLSTLRRYVEALGGRLEVAAVFPDQTIPSGQTVVAGSRASISPDRRSVVSADYSPTDADIAHQDTANQRACVHECKSQPAVRNYNLIIT